MPNRNRRWFLQATGAALATATLAGCIGDDDDVDEEEWEDVREIYLLGYQSHWEGVEPDFIEGDENPTLVLQEGEEYTIEWENGDGIDHDLRIEDDGGDTLESTETVGTSGDTASVTFTATEDMVTYICNYHRTTQVGDIDVV